jgi:hypothetical protein
VKRKENIILAGVSILMFAAIVSLSIFMITTTRPISAIPAPAIEVADSLAKAVLAGDTEAVSGHLCNPSEAHHRFATAELAEVKDIADNALAISLRGFTWESDHIARVQVIVHLERPVRDYDKVVSMVIYLRYREADKRLPRSSGGESLCNFMFFFDKASWGEEDEILSPHGGGEADKLDREAIKVFPASAGVSRHSGSPLQRSFPASAGVRLTV